MKQGHLLNQLRIHYSELYRGELGEVLTVWSVNNKEKQKRNSVSC